ncbi:MAG: hypothetical protein PVJ28_03170 [Acidimicrobiia bacterium]|jgi:hypothetical protein
MEAMVTAEDDGITRTFVGLTINDGPRTRRLILTRPYHEAGRIVEIPNRKISSIERVKHSSLGEQPRPD